MNNDGRRTTGDGRLKRRLRQGWDWLVDAHLELPEDREEEEVQGPRSKVQSQNEEPAVTAQPVEQEWQRRIRVLDESIERRKQEETLKREART